MYCAIPADVLRDMMTNNFAVINTLGRTCRDLARHIGVAANYARSELVAYRRGRLTPSRLPNGVYHGVSTYEGNRINESWYKCDYTYDRGQILRVTETSLDGLRHDTLVVPSRGLTLAYGEHESAHDCYNGWRVSMLVLASRVTSLRCVELAIRSPYRDYVLPTIDAYITWKPFPYTGHDTGPCTNIDDIDMPPADVEDMLAWYDESVLPRLSDLIPWFSAFVANSTPMPPWSTIPYGGVQLLPGTQNARGSPIDDETADREYLEIDPDADIDNALWTNWNESVDDCIELDIIEQHRAGLVAQGMVTPPYMTSARLNEIIDATIAEHAAM